MGAEIIYTRVQSGTIPQNKPFFHFSLMHMILIYIQKPRFVKKKKKKLFNLMGP